jgi:hypothetical protein
VHETFTRPDRRAERRVRIIARMQLPRPPPISARRR